MADLLTALSGSLVGFVLGLVGGGGSIIAVPLLMYVVGVASPHVAIGTSAIAVSLSAAANLVSHARRGMVKWPCAMSFSAAGMAGAWAGSSLAMLVPVDALLGLFGLLMVVVGIVMLLRKDAEGNPDIRLSFSTAREILPLLLGVGFAVGALSGFFGIGGGFLVVPGLMLATGMPIAYAIGTSLVAITVFGATTATNYAVSGLVDWRTAGLFIVGGILGGVIGPNLASATRNVLPVAFAGAYVALMVVALLSLLLMLRITFPPLVDAAQAGVPGRSVRELLRQPAFIVAIAAAALGYGVMNLLMAASPIAMQQCAHPFSAVALVLETHVLAMFAPSFFTGHLIKRFGVLRIMAVGVALNLACVLFALSGQEVMHFVGALIMLGLGWNFLYIGGTTLFTESYRPQEKTQAQAAMDTTVAATMALTSFSSGALVTTGGWQWMNLGSLVPMAATAAALIWLARQRAAAQNRAST